MPRTRKTKDIWVIQSYTGSQYGWEDVTAEETFTEGRAQLRTYRENEPGTSHRLVKKRERIQASFGNTARGRELRRVLARLARAYQESVMRPHDHNVMMHTANLVAQARKLGVSESMLARIRRFHTSRYIASHPVR